MASLLSTISGALGTAGSKPAKDEITLAVNGQKYEGWEEVLIKRSIKAISGGYDLKVISRWAEKQVPWAIVPGNFCTLSVGTDRLITGYVDSVSPSFSESGRSYAVSGRDKAADMVDCSAIHKPGNWASISLVRLAEVLAKPFGVKVTNNVNGLTVLTGVKIQDGETAFECLERSARLSGVLLVNDGEGGIVITRTGTVRAATRLVEGINLLSGGAQFSTKDRHSKYYVKSMGSGVADEDINIDFSRVATAVDEGVKRFRPLSIVAEGAATLGICKKRAQWEATVRAAKGSQISVVVQGWRQSNDALWTMNQLVNVESPSLGVHQDFLITGVTFRKTTTSTTTTLELERPDAYTPDPTLKDRKNPLGQLVLQESKRK